MTPESIQKEWDALEVMLDKGIIGHREYLYLLQELANA
jgi:hypothetical protein|tara:strand:+ start:471 stop:584 length:114 start_codon:yes stop_codon:yes gene_type:complete